MRQRGDVIIKVLRMISTAVLLFCLSGCMPPLPKTGTLQSGTYINKVPISVMGVRRGYLVHVPGDYQAGSAVPLVVVLHGAFSTAREAERQSGFSRLSDKENFIAVYPEGAFGILGFLQHWNAGHCCGRAADDNVDDTGFLDAVIRETGERLNIDKRRIYMVGMSNGGMLTYRYAAERSEVVAAIATISASLGGRKSQNEPFREPPPPANPVPLISFHGKDDQIVPYDGGTSREKGGAREYYSVKQSMDYWVRLNNCDTTPLTETLYHGAVTISTWKDRHDKNDVTLYSLDGWGHKWPTEYFTGRLDEGNPLKGFDSTGIIWQFLRTHSR